MGKFQGHVHNKLFNQHDLWVGSISILTQTHSLDNYEFVGRIASPKVLDQVVKVAMDDDLVGFKLIPVYKNEAEK